MASFQKYNGIKSNFFFQVLFCKFHTKPFNRVQKMALCVYLMEKLNADEASDHLLQQAI